MRKLVIFSAAFAAASAGVVYGLSHRAAIWIAAACLGLSVAVGALGWRRLCIGCLGLAAGLVWCLGYAQLWLAPAAQLNGSCQLLTVQLLDTPQHSDYGARAEVMLKIDGRRFEAVLYGDETLLEAQVGDWVSGTMEGKTVEGEQRYLRARGTAVCLYADGALEIEPGTPDWPMRVRQWLQARIHRFYPADSGALVRALLTGDRSELSTQVQNDLSVAGLSHAVAVSGMHVSMLLSMVVFCFGGNPRLTALFGMPLVVGFTLMTGASPSACRAAVMQILLLAAPLARREHDPPTSLSAAALLLLLENPWVIASVSFQLSFAAVAGLLLFSGRIQKRLMSLRKKPGRVWRIISAAISSSLGATVLTLPLTVGYFGLISLAAVATNLLALWAVTGVFTLGLLSCFIGKAVAIPASFLARYVLWMCRVVAAFPYAAAYRQNLPLMLWAVCAYGVAFWLLLGKKRKLVWSGCALTASFLLCILWGRWTLTAPVFRMLDVGQGQCTLLTERGFTAVIDCGGEVPENAAEQMARTLHSGGQTGVDVLLLTHYDADHAGGAVQLLHRVAVGAVILPDTEDESGMRQQVEQAAKAAGSRVIAVSQQLEVCFSGGKLTIYPPLSDENENNSGICVLATAEEYDILITGDVDQYTEMRLLSRYAPGDVDVLVAGHHGAESSTSSVLLKMVKPELVLISVGADNSYGHPAPETLARIEEAGATIRRTDQEGSIVLR